MTARRDNPSRRRIRVRGFALLVILSLTLFGLAFAQEEPSPSGDYLIGAGDLLNIVVWRNEELTRTVRVRPDGWISIPLLNDVHAAGNTPMQLREVLTQGLREFVSEPVIGVIVEETRSVQVSVLGKVRQPGRYQLDGPATVLDVLALAGGFDEFSTPDDVYVLRRNPESYQRLKVDYSDAVKAVEKDANPEVRRGDVIVVP